MDEYVKRETVINHLDACMDTIWKPEIVALKCFVEGIPAADVAPVRHGRWVSLRKGDWTSVYECSECKRKETVGCDRSKADEQVKRLYPYCHCGAKMDGAE